MTQFSSLEPASEEERLAALQRFEILDSAHEADFDTIVDLVRQVFGTDFAAINLIDRRRQWSKATSGIGTLNGPRETAFCNMTIRTANTFKVEDTMEDPRFRDNPLVVGAPFIRSYLGAPLIASGNCNVGALCVIDTSPRQFTEAEQQLLQNFARLTIGQINLRQIARQDGLTGALTRDAFHEHVNRALAKRDYTQTSLVVFDVDHFKSINDTYGHPAGDRALASIAQCMMREIRSADTIGRIGGEEFALLLENTGLVEAMHIADRLRRAVAGLPVEAPFERPVTISVGVAELDPGETSQNWFSRADEALYRAKRGGRNQVAAAAAGH